MNSTYCCAVCESTGKAPGGTRPKCPCGGDMVDMGTTWKPGKKGTKNRVQDDRQARRTEQRDGNMGTYGKRPRF